VEEYTAYLFRCDEAGTRIVVSAGCQRAAQAYTPFPPPLRLTPRRALLVSCSQGEMALRCARFEYGAGVMLANAWMHKEAFQTTDIPLMARVFVAILAVRPRTLIVRRSPPPHPLTVTF
jgi:hypothetical protein